MASELDKLQIGMRMRSIKIAVTRDLCDFFLIELSLTIFHIDNSQDFYTNLKKLLPTLFPGVDPDQVLQLFQQEQAQMIASLSLDDMERYFSVVNNSK